MRDERTAVVRDRLLDLVQELLVKRSIARTVTTDEQLTRAGLSSLDMVNLMLTIEAEFNVMIPAQEITAENFRSISSMSALIVRIETVSIEADVPSHSQPR